MEKRSKIQLL